MVFWRSASSVGAASKRASSSAVVICRTCNRVRCFFARETAWWEDVRQASTERIAACSPAGIASPKRARHVSSLCFIVGVCSQCVATRQGALAKILSRICSSSTSIFPVEAPINTFTPQACEAVSAFSSSRLSFVAPK